MTDAAAAVRRRARTTEVTDARRLRERDRGLFKVRIVTAATVVGSIAAASAIGDMVSVSYAASAAPKPTPAIKPPSVPTEAAPVQQAPPTPETITKVVHVQSGGGYIQAPARAPARSAASSSYAAPPPPAPACVSTPSRPCP